MLWPHLNSMHTVSGVSYWASTWYISIIHIILALYCINTSKTSSASIECTGRELSWRYSTSSPKGCAYAHALTQRAACPFYWWRWVAVFGTGQPAATRTCSGPVHGADEAWLSVGTRWELRRYVCGFLCTIGRVLWIWQLSVLYVCVCLFLCVCACARVCVHVRVYIILIMCGALPVHLLQRQTRLWLHLALVVIAPLQ